ncbi:hypothetical protein MYX76_15565 [Desulfobacterota bacterium AH_259_B03_O07]|nr:hypothetical protein [Desulfobacterota bacterium AH_259_B03_O07]
MRATSIEEVRSVRDSLDESYVVTTLSDVSVAPELGEATVNGVEYKLSSRALQQLCSMLGVPLHFAKTLSEKMPDVFRHLTNRLVYESSRLVTVKVNGYPQTILGLFNPREDYITLKRFLGIVETIYKAMSDFSGVEKLIVDINHESATAFFYTPKEFTPIRKDFTDIFKFGVAFSVSTLELYSPSVSESLYRLICSNMTYAPAFGGTRFRSRNEERIISAVGAILEDSQRVERYSELFSNLSEKRISYREAEEVRSQLERIKDSEGNVLVTDYMDRIPLNRIARAYGYSSAYDIPQSPSWKATAKTPISRYEAVNCVTAVGSNFTHISEKSRLDLLIYAGQLMFRERWDLDQIAPQHVYPSDKEVH